MDNIAIYPFKFKYLKDLQELSESRGGVHSKALTMKELPKIGFIAFLGKTAIAAGFLRRVEPNYAIFDSFFSNAYFGSQIRHNGLAKVWDALTEEAKDLELKAIIGFTKDDGMLQRAITDGFQIIDHTAVIKPLT